MRQSPATKEPCRSVHIPVSVLKRLAAPAKQRGVSPELLAYLLLDRIAEDDLVPAIMDDEETRGTA